MLSVTRSFFSLPLQINLSVGFAALVFLCLIPLVRSEELKLWWKVERRRNNQVTWWIFFVVNFKLGFLGGSCFSRGCGCFVIGAPERAVVSKGHLVFCLTFMVPCPCRETLWVLNALLLPASQRWSCHPGTCKPESVLSSSPLLFQK